MKRLNLRNLAKYFLHGVVFSALLFVVFFFSALLLDLLAVLGAYLGIIIGLLILVILIGVANGFITARLWFKIETSWAKYLYQGILLLILLGIVGLPIQYIYTQSTNIASVSVLLTGAILFIAASLINGYLGKRVGSIWELSEPIAPSTFQSTQTYTVAPPAAAAKPAVTRTIPVGPVNPEELKREEARLEFLLKHRQRTDLLNPESLDNLIETQKQTVENLRQALAAGNA